MLCVFGIFLFPVRHARCYIVIMTSAPNEIEIECNFCKKSVPLRKERLQRILGCPHCGYVLYELDDEAGRNLQYSKVFMESYLSLGEILLHMRRKITGTEEGLVGREEVKEARSLSAEITNQMALCDNETYQSMTELIPMIDSYLDLMDSPSVFEEKPTGEFLENIRDTEKNMNSFIRMMDMYLQIRRDF